MARTSGRRRNAAPTRREWGTVLAVRRSFTSRRVAVDAAAGAVSVVLRSGSIFEGAGTVELNDQVVAYTDWDSTTGALALAEPLASAAVEGDQVYLYLPRRQTRAVDLEADVEVDGWDGEPLPALLAPGVDRELPVGPRDPGEGEEVRVEYDEREDEWYVVLTRGLAEAAGRKAEANDAFTLTAEDVAAGFKVMPLSHVPVDESIKLVCGGVPQEPTKYTVDYEAATVRLPLGVLTGKDAAVGLRAWVHYWYLRGPVAALLNIPIGDTWSYAANLGSSTTYAQDVFDDSAWAVGPSPFGWGSEHINTIIGGSGSPLDVWQRRRVTTRGGDLTFSTGQYGVDNNAWVYLDGTLIWTLSYPGASQSLTVAAAAGDHVIAIRGTGDGNVLDFSAFAVTEGAS